MIVVVGGWKFFTKDAKTFFPFGRISITGMWKHHNQLANEYQPAAIATRFPVTTTSRGAQPTDQKQTKIKDVDGGNLKTIPILSSSENAPSSSTTSGAGWSHKGRDVSVSLAQHIRLSAIGEIGKGIRQTILYLISWWIWPSNWLLVRSICGLTTTALPVCHRDYWQSRDRLSYVTYCIALHCTEDYVWGITICKGIEVIINGKWNMNRTRSCGMIAILLR